jgi:hypothetical protein
MAVSIGKLNVAITATADQLNRTLDAAEAKLSSFGKAISQTGTGRGGPGLFSRATLLEVGGAFAAATAGAAALFGWVKRIGDEVDEIADTSEVLGLSADDLAGLRLAGGGAAGFDKSFEKFQRSISEAANGSKTLQDAFKRIGLDARVLAEMDPAVAWLALVDALQKTESAADRIAARMEILGKGSAAVADKLAKGTEHWMKQLELTTGTQAMLSKVADAADRYEQASARAGFIWQNMKADAANVFADFVDAVTAAKEFGIGALSGTGAGHGLTGLTGFDVQRERMMATLAAEQKAREKLTKETEAKNKAELESLAAATMQLHLKEQEAEAERRANLAERLHKELTQPITDVGSPAFVEFGSAAARREQIQADREHQLSQMNANRQTDPKRVEQLLNQILAAEAATKSTMDTIKRIVNDRLQGVRPVAIP